jgi:hypothetical protein
MISEDAMNRIGSPPLGRAGIAAGALSLLLVAACGGAGSHGPHMGTATFQWSLQERFVPADCYAWAASAMEVVVYDAHGVYVEGTSASCTAFAATTALAAGWYSATLQLADDAGRPVSTALDTGPFAVSAGADVLIDTDFPADSFY